MRPVATLSPEGSDEDEDEAAENFRNFADLGGEGEDGEDIDEDSDTAVARILSQRAH